MNIRDPRIIDQYEQINDLQKEQRTCLFVIHPFAQMPLVTGWIQEQLKAKIIDRLPARYQFDDFPFTPAQALALTNGDLFFARLFADNNLLPPDVSPAGLTPLTDTLRGIYTEIWKQPSDDENDIGVYRDLKEHIEELMGISLATMPLYAGITKWQDLIDSFSHYGTFYHSLVDHIPATEIEKRWNELQYAYSADNVLADAGYPMSHKEGPEYHNDYVATMLELASKGTTAWQYTEQLTKHSQYTSFEESLSLKLVLVLRLSPARWVQWLDHIWWPLPQAVALHYFRNLTVIEQLIEAIVSNPVPRLTDPAHLLAISLREYMRLLMDISCNLFSISNDRDPMPTPEKITVKLRGESAYKAWTTNELQDSIKKVLTAIFPSQPISVSPYFEMMADFVTTQNPEQWNGNVYREPWVLTIDTLHKTFVDLLVADSLNKQSHADRLCDTNCNWVRLGIISELYRHDTTDDHFRKEALRKFILFAASKDFRWNTGFDYNNDVISQAYQAAVLIQKEPDPDGFLLALIQSNRIYHEGWSAGRNTDGEQFRKELYWILAAISLVHIRYKEGQNAIAQKLLQEIVTLLLKQYRVAASDTDRQHYRPAFKFIIETLVRFDLAGLTDFCRLLLQKMDNIRDFLLLAEHLVHVASRKGIAPAAALLDEIAARIDQDYWQIEAVVYLKGHPIMHALTTAAKSFREYHKNSKV